MSKEGQMGLLKLSQSLPNENKKAQQKAIDILNKIPSKNLIQEAYLFGSAVDGVFTPDSDLDILVVTKDEAAIKLLQQEVYRPRFADIAIDWIFKTQQSFNDRKDFGGVCFVAFHSGMKIL